MAIKVICDRCEGEIDGRSDDYRKIYFMFGHDDDVEEYDLCPNCFTSVKRSITENLLKYELIRKMEEDNNGKINRNKESCT